MVTTCAGGSAGAEDEEATGTAGVSDTGSGGAGAGAASVSIGSVTSAGATAALEDSMWGGDEERSPLPIDLNSTFLVALRSQTDSGERTDDNNAMQ